jgi:dUTP pyrophosphatase
MDLHAVESVTVEAGRWAAVGTGLSLEIPAGYEGQVRPRSGLAAKRGVTVLNSPGTIDPGYRGEVRVLLVNHSDVDFEVRPGDRIAQLLISAYAAVEWSWAEDLEQSSRAEGGFGSTGVGSS